MADAEKEQIKLRASYLNGIAIAVMVLGMITPVLAAHRAIFITKPLLDVDGLAASALSMSLAFIFSRILHNTALSHLGKLRPPNLPEKSKEEFVTSPSIKFTARQIKNSDEEKMQK